jgi:hypothetical protein
MPYPNIVPTQVNHPLTTFQFIDASFNTTLSSTDFDIRNDTTNQILHANASTFNLSDPTNVAYLSTSTFSLNDSANTATLNNNSISFIDSLKTSSLSNVSFVITDVTTTANLTANASTFQLTDVSDNAVLSTTTFKISNTADTLSSTLTNTSFIITDSTNTAILSADELSIQNITLIHHESASLGVTLSANVDSTLLSISTPEDTTSDTKAFSRNYLPIIVNGNAYFIPLYVSLP